MPTKMHAINSIKQHRMSKKKSRVELTQSITCGFSKISRVKVQSRW